VVEPMIFWVVHFCYFATLFLKTKLEDYGSSMKIHHISKISKLKKKYWVEHNCHTARPTVNLEVLV
jgi:hypothetical protein